MLKCPKCAKKGKASPMRVTHTHACGLNGSVQRLFCDVCLTVGAAHCKIIAVDPAHGQGAEAIAKKLRLTAQGAVGPSEGE